MSASPPDVDDTELYGPYLHAPVWPWLTAGWLASALFVIWVVIAAVAR